MAIEVQTQESASPAETYPTRSPVNPLTSAVGVSPGDHLCLFYDDDPAEQFPVLLPYIRQGLEQGERCIYVADDNTLAQVEAALAGYGIDVAAAVGRGALLLWTRADWRQPGDLDSSRKAKQVREVIHAALAAGFTGVRFAVEMTWTLAPDIDVERLRHWEATINTIFTPDVPACIICQYSRRRLSPATVHAALRTHPLAVLGTEACPNPFYDAPRILAGRPFGRTAGEAQDVDWMIDQLTAARAYARERERRIRAESALQASELLRHQVEELYDVTEMAAADLHRAIAVKDEFIGLVSHELRTPITVILGNALVLQRTLSIESAGQRQALLDIRSEAERLNRVIANLLILAKLEGDRVEVVPVLAGVAVERVVEEHRRRFPGRSVRVRDASGGAPCLGNEAYVEQILANLLTNAQKYSPAAAAIEVVVDREGDWCTIRVLDRGMGLDAALIDQVFEAFYRTDEASRLTAGIGIGLTVCKRLVEAQGGRIWAHARPGGGSEFGFTLPLCEAPPD